MNGGQLQKDRCLTVGLSISGWQVRDVFLPVDTWPVSST